MKDEQYRRQHYNPVVYLREFASKKKKELWEFDLNQGTAKPSTPKDSGCEDFYHSITLENGEEDRDSIERAFGPFESRLPELFEAIRHPTKTFPDEAWRLFFIFAAIQYARSPKTVRKVHDFLSKGRQAAFEMLSQGSAVMESRTEEGFDPLRIISEFEIQASKGAALLPILEALPSIAQIFAEMKWSFLSAPAGRHFITSDRPVCCWLPTSERSIFGAGLRDPNIEVTFPLSKRVCAFGCWTSPYPQPFHEAPAEIVDSFNKSTVMNGWRFVYGPLNDPDTLGIVQVTAKARGNILPLD